MTQRRGTEIKQGAIADVMSCLSKLPERGKAPDMTVSLSEIFRAKEYLAEIKGALKKGYTFDDLAAIFTERCGVNISARQLKYHCTREKNRSAKNSAGGKSTRHAVSNVDVRPENPARTNARDNAEGDAGGNVSAANVPPIHATEHTAFAAPDAEDMSAGAGATSFENRPLNG